MGAVYIVFVSYLVLCLIGLSQESDVKYQHDRVKELSDQQRASNVHGHRNKIAYSLLGDGMDEHLPRKTIENVRISPLHMRSEKIRMRSTKKDTQREKLNDAPITESQHLENKREQPRHYVVPQNTKSKQNPTSKSSIRTNNRHANATIADSYLQRGKESFQTILRNAKSPSDSKPLANLNSIGEKSGICSTGSCSRQLCPWTASWTTEYNRSPVHIREVSCEGHTCQVKNVFWPFVEYFQRKTECATVTTDISVFVDDLETTQTVRVACICQYKRGVITSTYKGDRPSHAYSNLSQTGKMSHIVKLDKMEDLDGIDPDILEHVLPLHHRHRNRKLREQGENESSGKLKKDRRHQSPHGHDFKLEKIIENV